FSVPNKRRARIHLPNVRLERHRKRNAANARSQAPDRAIAIFHPILLFNFYAIGFLPRYFLNAEKICRRAAEVPARQNFSRATWCGVAGLAVRPEEDAGAARQREETHCEFLPTH